MAETESDKAALLVDVENLFYHQSRRERALARDCLAALLWWSEKNRLANRFLALLLVVIVARLGPYIIGYAGYYDAYPWLSFAPYNFSLAFGPLLFLYVWCLTRPMPRRNLIGIAHITTYSTRYPRIITEILCR